MDQNRNMDVFQPTANLRGSMMKAKSCPEVRAHQNDDHIPSPFWLSKPKKNCSALQKSKCYQHRSNLSGTGTSQRADEEVKPILAIQTERSTASTTESSKKQNKKFHRPAQPVQDMGNTLEDALDKLRVTKTKCEVAKDSYEKNRATVSALREVIRLKDEEIIRNEAKIKELEELKDRMEKEKARENRMKALYTAATDVNQLLLAILQYQKVLGRTYKTQTIISSSDCPGLPNAFERNHSSIDEDGECCTDDDLSFVCLGATVAH